MELSDLRFLDPHAETRLTKNRLPHWQQNGAVYFVSFHLADSLPRHLLDQWENERRLWLRLHPEPWTSAIEREYHQRFSAAIERWLDAGHGSCLLRNPACAQIVAQALQHFDSERCAQVAWVVMPNHVHCLCAPREGFLLEKLVHSWKRFSAGGINQALGRSGSLWQRDYFDRIVRDAEHFDRCVRYIRRNPEEAGLRDGQYFRHENDLARSVE